MSYESWIIRHKIRSEVALICGCAKFDSGSFTIVVDIFSHGRMPILAVSRLHLIDQSSLEHNSAWFSLRTQANIGVTKHLHHVSHISLDAPTGVITTADPVWALLSSYTIRTRTDLAWHAVFSRSCNNLELTTFGYSTDIQLTHQNILDQTVLTWGHQHLCIIGL